MKRTIMLLAGLIFFVCLSQPIRAMADEKPQDATVEYMVREFTAYAIRPTENLQLYIPWGQSWLEVSTINYSMASDNSEAMKAGQQALLILMRESGATQTVANLSQFQTTLLNGAAVDLLLRSGQSKKNALATMARAQRAKNTEISQAYATWVNIRDQIRFAAMMNPGYDQATVAVPGAVIISR